MKRHQRLRVAQTRRQELTKERVIQKAPESLVVPLDCSCRKGAPLTMMTTSRFALRFKMESASSRDQLASGAQEDFINVIRKDASVQSHITFARILTDMGGRHLQFHKVHHLVLWSSSQEEVLFHERRYKRGSELLVLTTKWYSRLHQ